jgi:hypothetical protein
MVLTNVGAREQKLIFLFTRYLELVPRTRVRGTFVGNFVGNFVEMRAN